MHDSLLLQALRCGPVPRPPIWLMRQAGRYMAEYRAVRENISFLELCRSPRLCADVMADAVERIGVDAAIIFSDILPILIPLGFDLEYLRGDGPVIRNPFRTEEDLSRLSETFDLEQVSYVFETVAETRRAVPQEKALIGFAGAPFTLASYAVEGGTSRTFNRTKELMYVSPQTWHSFLDRLQRSIAAYLNAQIEAGAEVVQIFDSWVGVLNQSDYRRYVLPYTAQLIASIKPSVPVIYFGTGNPMLLPAMAETKAGCIGVDWRIPIDQAWNLIGRDRAIQGNLDPAVLLADKKTIIEKTDEILLQAGDQPGFIFNLGHGVLKETPVENVITLVERVKEYRCE